MAIANKVIANPPEKRKRGRPVGSKSKSTLHEAVSIVEANQVDAVRLFVAIMNNTVEGEDIPIKDRASAAKVIMGGAAAMRKGFQETKETIDTGIISDEAILEVVKAEVIPLVQLTIQGEHNED